MPNVEPVHAFTLNDVMDNKPPRKVEPVNTDPEIVEFQALDVLDNDEEDLSGYIDSTETAQDESPRKLIICGIIEGLVLLAVLVYVFAR